MFNIFPRLDWSIIVCILILFAFSLATISSVAPDFLLAQVGFCVFGLILFFIFAHIDYHVYFSLKNLIYIGVLALLGITLFLGFESRGALRWIAIGSIRLQFSEIIKPFFVVAFAATIQASSKKSFQRFLIVCAFLIVPVLMVFKQPDLGSAVVYLFGGVLMIISSQMSLVYLLISSLLSLLTIPVLWFFLADYQKKRILTFLSPSSDPLGSSYNAIQSVITVGSGMFFGKGLGRGTQSHLLFLPEHHTDFIFASIAEEFGFVGSVAVVAVYFFLVWRIFSLAITIDDLYGRLIVVGIGGFILTQVVINIGMNIGVLPVTGITLPLISYGGSSLLSTMIGLGIIENIASVQKGESTLHIV